MGEGFCFTGDERPVSGCREPFDALLGASWPMLHRVRLSGEGEPAGMVSELAVLASVDATGLLLRFARGCVLDVLHLWAAPNRDAFKRALVRSYRKRNEDVPLALGDDE